MAQTRRDLAQRDSIRLEAVALRDVGLALVPLDFTERRRVLFVVCNRFGIDPTKLVWNADGSPR